MIIPLNTINVYPRGPELHWKCVKLAERAVLQRGTRTTHLL